MKIPVDSHKMQDMDSLFELIDKKIHDWSSLEHGIFFLRFTRKYQMTMQNGMDAVKKATAMAEQP